MLSAVGFRVSSNQIYVCYKGIYTYLEKTLANRIGQVGFFQIGVAEADLHGGHAGVKRNTEVREIFLVGLSVTQDENLGLHFKEIVFT